MVKNIIFDIGNVIMNFKINEVIPKFTDKKEEQEFIMKNIINSPEWLQYGLIDTGYITREEAIEIVKDRTNHVNDELIAYFWNHYNDYCTIDKVVIDLIKKLKYNGYKIYLLSNINLHTYNCIKNSELFTIVDGYILSYQVNKIKPYIGIYKELINKYNLDPEKSLFIDDNIKNVTTANKLGILGKVVQPDNSSSVINMLNEYNIKI